MKRPPRRKSATNQYKSVVQRTLRLETLESRTLLSVDWRNPVDHLDVNSNLYRIPFQLPLFAQDSLSETVIENVTISIPKSILSNNVPTPVLNPIETVIQSPLTNAT